ncbi:sensor histidine kinase [Robiginitalea sp. SC105]|uniref:sensor histidine kinase n=1 Tax=Robiginitalea sp. SC105 TaxID=2762332 RepID=UPI001639E2CE|nr:histidine kinase [Robiginitalea sp. SC105]MBC2839284.1 histidine kinase [Robiginitalea sp. SC105]
MAAKPIKQATILRISLLLALLVSIPRNVYLYNMMIEGKMGFSGIWFADFLFRIAFLVTFGWLILQLNANLAYTRVTWPPYLRFTALILADIGILVLFIALWEFLHGFLAETELTREDIGFLKFRYAILLLVLFFIARILRLQTEQQENLIEYERLKQQNLQNELAAIKNQVDPHFLFNSLNSLTSLIRDNEPATKFVRKLSHMYRYILQSGDNNLVPVREELKFLESYTYLIKTRYRDRFDIGLDIAPELLSATIPPLALQLLVENAVKHNEISESNPLKVEIYSEGDSLVVANKIRERTSLPDQTGYGLTNLQKRFSLIKKTDIVIRRTADTFTVTLPLKPVA